jgi:hypothetical protein
MDRFNKSVYVPKNKEKYLCKNKYCIARSSWERDFMKHLDNDPNIKGWCSECIVVPYYFNGKPHRYYTDFYVIDKDNRHVVVEVKPHRQTLPPRKSKKKSKKTILYENFTYQKNKAKWEAAKKYCKKRGWNFKIITEKNMRL